MGVGTGLGIAGIASAGIGAAGSFGAAQTQAGAAESAQQLQAKQAQEALDFQKQQFATQQANEAPFLAAGQGAVQDLSYLLGGPKPPGFPVGAPGAPSSGAQGSLLQPWTGQFQAPTIQEAEQFPGYQFQLQQGLGAIQNSAAAKGGLLSGNTEEALNNFAQQSAQSDYQNVYNNSLQQYLLGYNQFQQNQANQYNRLAGLAGTGQVSAGQLGQQGGQAAGNISNTLLTTGAQQGANINLGGAATASGYAGAANAGTSALGNLTQLSLLQQLLSGGGGNINDQAIQQANIPSFNLGA